MSVENTDLTERKPAETTLELSEATVRALLDAPGVILVLLDADGHIIACNEAAARRLGRPREAAVGGRLEDMLPGMPPGRGLAVAALAVRRRRSVRFEVRDGGRWFEVVLSPVVGGEQGCRRIILAAHEITHLKEAEAHLREAKAIAETANRAKTEFLANMSHELRTPLNAIIGFADVIHSELFGPIGEARYRDYAADILNSGKHLLDLINDILDISRIEIGAVTLEEDKVDPAFLLRSCVRLVSERAGKGGVALDLELAEGLPAVLVDSRRLKQVLINLLSNAVKFTPSGGRVVASAGLLADGGFCFRISDTGIGMSQAEIAVALKPFGQVDSGYGRRYEGVGLGLPLSKALVELHGGRLDVASRKGAGTTVSAILPAGRVLDRE